MTSLSDQIDHFYRFTKAIKATALSLSDIGVAGPFTRAVLDTQLGDLIRDIDPSELGLFHLVDSSHPSTAEKDAPRPPPIGVTRVEFGSATPLRRTIARRDDHTKHNAEPEVYAEAAIKYIDRYDPIRPMPRTHSQATAILQRLGDVRRNMKSILQSLERIQSEEAPPLKSLNECEEERASEIKAEIAVLKQREKQMALAQHKLARNETTSQVDQVAFKPTLPSHHKPEFAPITTAKTLHFTESLMDEVVDVSHFTDVSMATHVSDLRSSCETSIYVPSTPERYTTDEKVKGDGTEEDTEMYSIEVTSTQEELPVAATSLSRGDASSEPEQLFSSSATIVERPFVNYKIQANKDIERIAAKIWQTAADIINPNHQLDASEGNVSAPPCAKEVIARLQSLSQLHISPTSPSVMTETSLSTMARTHPTSQQILIAHLLLTLLSTQHYALPLNKAKEVLAAKAGGSSVGASTSRIIYGCVAKRLVKIDRSGGREQIVKFDI